MKFNVLTLTLHNFVSVFSAGSSRVTGAANGLLASLVVIDVVLMGLWWALDGGDRLSSISKKLLYIGFWTWMVRSFPSLAKSFTDSLIQAGHLAGGGGGGGVGLLMDPSRIASYGLDATEPLAKKFSDFGVTEIGEALVYGISYLAIIGCFLIMAIHVFMAVLEYYLVTAVVGIFMPFGLLASTKFLAEKAIGAVVAVGIKLMTMSFLLSAIEPVLQSSLKFSSPDVPLNELFAMFLTVCALMLLTWKAPSLASSLMTGSPSLGTGDAIAPALAAAGIVASTKKAAATGGASVAAQGAGSGLRSLSTASASSGAGAGFSAASHLGSPAAQTSPSAAPPSRSSSTSAPASTGPSPGAGASAPPPAGASPTLVMSSQQPPSTPTTPQLASSPSPSLSPASSPAATAAAARMPSLRPTLLMPALT